METGNSMRLLCFVIQSHMLFDCNLLLNFFFHKFCLLYLIIWKPLTVRLLIFFSFYSFVMILFHFILLKLCKASCKLTVVRIVGKLRPFREFLLSSSNIERLNMCFFWAVDKRVELSVHNGIHLLRYWCRLIIFLTNTVSLS